MEKEQVIENLEEVFVQACDLYKKMRGVSLTEIRELGETIIKAKQDVHHDLMKAERFIENQIERHVKLHRSESVVTKEAVETKGGHRYHKVIGISEKTPEDSE